jgi:hypothetical protein
MVQPSGGLVAPANPGTPFVPRRCVWPDPRVPDASRAPTGYSMQPRGPGTRSGTVVKRAWMQAGAQQDSSRVKSASAVPFATNHIRRQADCEDAVAHRVCFLRRSYGRSAAPPSLDFNRPEMANANARALFSNSCFQCLPSNRSGNRTKAKSSNPHPAPERK